MPSSSPKVKLYLDKKGAFVNLTVDGMFRSSIVFGLLVLLGPVHSGPLVQQIGDFGIVDWTHFLIRTAGTGTENPALPPGVRSESALDAAKKDALVKVLQVLTQMKFNSDLSVGTLLAADDSLHLRVMDVVSENLRIVEKVYLSDGSIELDVELSLLGTLMDLLLPDVGGVVYPVSDVSQKALTGVVIDARGLNLNPSLLPRVLSEDGTEVYGKGFVEREHAIRIGVCGWMDSLDVTSERVGNSPLILRAKDVSGQHLTDLVISNEDARILRISPTSSTILKQCKFSVFFN